MELRIELIACGDCGLRNNADGWLPSFIVDFLLLFAGCPALTYLTSSGRCQHHSRGHHAKSFCIHLYWVMIARMIIIFTCVRNTQVRVHVQQYEWSKSIIVQSTLRNTTNLFQYIDALNWIHRHISLSNELRSEWASKCMSKVECASKVSKWMSERCKQLSGKEEQMARCLARWFHTVDCV